MLSSRLSNFSLSEPTNLVTGIFVHFEITVATWFSSTVLLSNDEFSLLNFRVANSSCNLGIVPCFKTAACS